MNGCFVPDQKPDPDRPDCKGAREGIANEAPRIDIGVGMETGQCHQGSAFTGMKEARSLVFHKLAVEPSCEEVPAIDQVCCSISAHDHPHGATFPNDSLVIPPRQKVGVVIHTEHGRVGTQPGVC